MHTYTEQDTERARAADSSAGQQTQQLRGTAAPVAQAPARRSTAAALALISLGALMLAGRLAEGWLGTLDGFLFGPLETEGGLFFLTIASVFLFFSFWKRIYGLLIPGCIIAGFAFGVTFSNLIGGAPFFWGIALGFLAILAAGRTMFGNRSMWPIYPGVALLAFGTVVAMASAPAIFSGAFVVLPLLLIGAGLLLGRRSPAV